MTKKVADLVSSLELSRQKTQATTYMDEDAVRNMSEEERSLLRQILLPGTPNISVTPERILREFEKHRPGEGADDSTAAEGNHRVEEPLGNYYRLVKGNK